MFSCRRTWNESSWMTAKGYVGSILSLKATSLPNSRRRLARSCSDVNLFFPVGSNFKSPCFELG
jgi:hypothetical protein